MLTPFNIHKMDGNRLSKPAHIRKATIDEAKAALAASVAVRTAPESGWFFPFYTGQDRDDVSRWVKERE